MFVLDDVEHVQQDQHRNGNTDHPKQNISHGDVLEIGFKMTTRNAQPSFMGAEKNLLALA